jgi:hypothetical protein
MATMVAMQWHSSNDQSHGMGECSSGLLSHQQAGPEFLYKWHYEHLDKIEKV